MAGPGEGASQDIIEGRGDPISSKIFVGNLDFDTTSEDLQDLFGQGDAGVQVTVPTDRMTGRPRGFAFVEFASEEAAAQAIQKFDGYELAGRRLRVNEATEDRRGSAGGYGGGERSFTSPPRPGKRPSRPKGSRRNARARKRSIW